MLSQAALSSLLLGILSLSACSGPQGAGSTIAGEASAAGPQIIGSLLPIRYQHARPHLALLDSGMTGEDFTQLIAPLAAMMRPRIEALGGQMQLEADWSRSEVNAFALRQGSVWSVQVLGGLIQAPGITPDALLLATCHEFGHLFAGYPFWDQTSWASATEGQADYFAVKDCARRLWASDGQANHQAGLKATVAQRTTTLPIMVTTDVGPVTFDRSYVLCGGSGPAAADSRLVLTRIALADADGDGTLGSGETIVADFAFKVTTPQPLVITKMTVTLNGAVVAVDAEAITIAPQGAVSTHVTFALPSGSCGAPVAMTLAIATSAGTVWYDRTLTMCKAPPVL